MEALLSLAFDNLSSYDGPKIRKGLRQVEGLLAQICLSSAPAPTQRRNGTTRKRNKEAEQQEIWDDGTGEPRPEDDDDGDDETASEQPRKKTLADLSEDPAFREFFKLQEGFEWNVALRLVSTLDRLMAKGADGQNDLLILSALDLIQGVMLLHPPSKALFSREQYMNLLLDLMEPVNCPAIQSATLLTLVVALIDTPHNTRTFEDLDGLLTVTSLFKSKSTAREVKLKLVEFLYFYLMPEVPSIPRAGARDSVPAILQQSPNKLAAAFRDGGRPRADSDTEDAATRTQEDKQALLSRHLSSVEDLVKDLKISTPFGGVVC